MSEKIYDNFGSVYLTEGALISGEIIKCTVAEWHVHGDTYERQVVVWWRGHLRHIHKPNWHVTEREARERVDRMRRNKIQLLLNRITGLELIDVSAFPIIEVSKRSESDDNK